MQITLDTHLKTAVNAGSEKYARVSLVICLILFSFLLKGAKYKDECPVESMIPIYLIVAGAASLVGNCCSGVIRWKNRDEAEKKVNPLEIVVMFFLFVWFICGNVWIYKTYEPNYTDPGSPDFCNKTLYLFAFWVTTAYYIVFGVVLVAICFLGLWVAYKVHARVRARGPPNIVNIGGLPVDLRHIRN